MTKVFIDYKIAQKVIELIHNHSDQHQNEVVLSFDQSLLSSFSLFLSFNPIVVGLFDSTILVGGGQKSPPYLTLYW